MDRKLIDDLDARREKARAIFAESFRRQAVAPAKLGRRRARNEKTATSCEARRRLRGRVAALSGL